MRYCTECGSPLEFRIPENDNMPRHVCSECGHIHYQNPKVVAGCIVEWEEGLLLCRRAIEPRRGYWTLPAGFLENGESTSEGAMRETVEEACAEVDDPKLFSLINVPRINQIHMFYRANPRGRHFAPGAETLETALFREQDIPWKELAFPTVFHTVMLYLQDRARGSFGLHTFDLGEDAWKLMQEKMKELSAGQ